MEKFFFKSTLMNILQNKQVKICLFFCMFIFSSFTLNATEWPQELNGDKGNIIIYQPQPEKLIGNILTGRAAMQLELHANKEPVFGVFWFSSTIETDRSTNSVIIKNIEVTKVGWSDSTESDEMKFTQFVEDKLQNSSFAASLSKLTATLSNAETVKQSLENIKNDAPIILFENELAVLLSYDGKPIFKEIENSLYQRALNTQFAVVKVKNEQQYYLTSGSLWYQASNELGPWKVTTNPPTDLVAMIAKDDKEASKNKPAIAPLVITATKPTELIVSDGKPEWVSLTGGKLLYVKNTETPWLREISSGDMYILLSGRWFKRGSERNPWTFIRADKLPKSFKDIPPESDIGGLRSSVAGTDEANQAILDAQIPQTAAIKRSEAKLTVQYDGEPKFVLIEGTDVEHAVNTNAQVLKIENKFYAVDNGVWFVADTAKGAWIVADSIPTSAIAQIPPSSPVYNTTYVKIYDSTPEIVYVGYTPGYMWSYPYYGVPIYGTGWYYPPYYGAWYYPRPPTWGMHIGYNPWTGWRVGVSWGSPFFRVGVSWGGGYHRHYRPCCGYYGGHRGGYRRGHSTNIHVNGNINIGNSVSVGNRARVSNNISKSPNNLKNNKRSNLYNSNQNKSRNAKVTNQKSNVQKARSTSKRTNNLYSDRQGNVVRDNNGQWQQRSNQSWKGVPQQNNRNISTRPNTGLPSMNNNINRQMPNHSMNRQTPSFNHNNMNQARHARSMGGGFNGGGGGRRR